jgi:DNA sulfur modification protein DndC
MQLEPTEVRYSAFTTLGFRETLRRLREQIKDLYLSDEIPWVIGYSGGKDSTATLQLIWSAVAELPPEKRAKRIYVISTDTLVENPIVAMWVEHSLKQMAISAVEQAMPIEPNRLTPAVKDRFWVNLIGKGYPAPRPKFRWCTSRLKINPSNDFINRVVDQNGEAILVLGSRKEESEARKATIEKYEGSTRELLSKNGNPRLDRVWVYTPVSNWTSDDIWQYLMQVKNPWGYNNKDLLGMYQGATADGECPLVVDTSTPSCGDSRFGCFVCTLVEQDKSMQAMIRNDQEKEWMLPLAELRNRYLDTSDDRKHRDFRRMDGSLTLFNGRLVHGPYKQAYREELLKALLIAQAQVQEKGPEAVREFQLISLDELREIRRIWIEEKHEIEDVLPLLYEKATGSAYPDGPFDEGHALQPEDINLLKKLCADDGEAGDIHFQMVRELLHTESRYRTVSRRVGLYDALESTVSAGGFSSEDEALKYKVAQNRQMDKLRAQGGLPRQMIQDDELEVTDVL